MRKRCRERKIKRERVREGKGLEEARGGKDAKKEM